MTPELIAADRPHAVLVAHDVIGATHVYSSALLLACRGRSRHVVGAEGRARSYFLILLSWMATLQGPPSVLARRTSVLRSRSLPVNRPSRRRCSSEWVRELSVWDLGVKQVLQVESGA